MVSQTKQSISIALQKLKTTFKERRSGKQKRDRIKMAIFSGSIRRVK